MPQLLCKIAGEFFDGVDYLPLLCYGMFMTREKMHPIREDGESSGLTSKEEEELDRIVDTTGCSYDDARRKMGLPVDDPKEIGNLIKSVSLLRKVGEKSVRGFFCGDCCRYIEPGKECSHVRVGSRGGRYASDSSKY